MYRQHISGPLPGGPFFTCSHRVVLCALILTTSAAISAAQEGTRAGSQSQAQHGDSIPQKSTARKTRSLGVQPADFNSSQIPIDTPARLLRDLAVTYPEMEYARGHAGIAIVTVFIDEYGSVPYVELHSSSGYAALDSAALQSAFDAQFAPAKTNGKAVCARITMPVEFRVARVKEEYDAVKSVDELRQEAGELERARDMLMLEQQKLERELKALRTKSTQDSIPRVPAH
jgi:TonB family protein